MYYTRASSHTYLNEQSKDLEAFAIRRPLLPSPHQSHLPLAGPQSMRDEWFRSPPPLRRQRLCLGT